MKVWLCPVETYYGLSSSRTRLHIIFREISAGRYCIRGEQGAGDTKPSLSDFITVSGQVVAERFQFLWTLLACLGFVAPLLSQDPATIDGFPTFLKACST